MSTAAQKLREPVFPKKMLSLNKKLIVGNWIPYHSKLIMDCGTRSTINQIIISQ